MKDQKEKKPQIRFVDAKEFARLTDIDLGTIKKELDDVAQKAKKGLAEEE